MNTSTRLLLLVVQLLMSIISVEAQQFAGRALPKYAHPALDAQFARYEVYRLEPGLLANFFSGQEGDVTLQLELGDHQWLLQMAPSEIIDPEYRLRVAQPEGEVSTLPWRHDHIAWSGRVLAPAGLEAALTVTEEMIYGYVAFADEDWFIEPVWYFDPSVPRDLVVVYAASDVRPNGGTCAAIELASHERPALPAAPDKHTGDQPEGVVNNCYEVELAIASDWLMYQKYGSTAAVESHNVGVMNNVATNYDNEFNHEIQFVIVEQFVSSCSTCDPWTSSTDAGALLNSFTSWGPTGFTATHDLGQLWTDRDFNGATVGIAWVGAVCTSFRYHCLQDFTSNANFLRVMTAHEIGHNFNAGHNDPPCGCIMDPTLNNTNTWSSQSVNIINNYITGLINQGNCLSACAPQAPPVANFSASPTSGCAPLVVQYTDLSSNQPTSWQWTFPGGSPSSSTQQNPVVTYSAPGTYGATLTATNAAGSNTVTMNNLITVEGTPSASFSYVLAGLTATFINTTTGNVTSYLWDFGDGNISTQSDPIHTYAQDGFYQVTLTATNACGSTVYVQTLTVFVPPQAGFSATPTTGCAPLTVQFTDESTPNVLNWNWTFEGAVPGSSTAQNPTVQYQAPGTYGVTLTVSNPAGTDTYSVSDYITVNITPVPAFTASVNLDTATFTNQSVNADSYTWDFGDGNTSTEPNPTHVYAQDGTYTVKLTATNECGSSSTTQTITILTPPQGGFTASPTSGCAPLTVQFTDQSSSNVLAWEWHFEGGNPAMSADRNPVVVYDTPGTWDVTLIVHNGAGSDTVSMPDMITVNDVPTASFVASVNLATATFVNASQNADSYLWDFGDGTTSSDASPVHTYAADGTYTVTLTATNACGSHTATQQLTISTQPQAGLSANATSGCAPFTVQFMDQSSANVTSWQWTFEGGSPSSSTDQNPVVTYQSAGVYGVTLTVSNAAGSSTVEYPAYITVGDVPAASFGVSQHLDTVWLSNGSADATSYWWDFGDGTTSTSSDPMHVYASDGTYTIVLVATNGCGSDTVQQQVTIVTPPQAGLTANATSGCAPFEVQFTDQSSANVTSWQWTFEGGTPSSSTDQNPVVTYQSAGVYGVTLTVSNAAGSSTVEYADYITVGDVPAASFGVSQHLDTVWLSNGSADAMSYWWDFGDGTTSTASDPMHVYASDGTYTIVLVATNGCGSDTVQQQVTIVTPPQAGLTANATSGCAPFEVQFTDQSSANATSWQWTFEGGSPSSSTDQNPVVTYQSAGVYGVTLTVSNAAGSSTVEYADYITVGDVPAASFGVSQHLDTVWLSNGSADATSYWWDFGDGTTSTSSDPMHVYASDGTYTIVLVATNGCGSDTVQQQVTIVTPPQAGLSANATSGCAPFEVQFTDQSSANATSWQWTFEGGSPSSSTDQNPVVTYQSAGVYGVTLTVSNAAGSSTVEYPDYITVGDVPQVDITATSVNGATATFSAVVSGADSLWWDFGDGTTSSETNPEHTYAADDAYTVVLAAMNACGTATADTLVVIATQAPVAAFTSDVQTGCPGMVVQFENLSSPNAEWFEWTFAGGEPATSNAPNPVVTYSQPGTYDVTLVAGNAAGSDTFALSGWIVVHALPQAAFAWTVDDTTATVTFEDLSQDAESWYWDFGDGTTSTEASPVHAYGQVGTFSVMLVVGNTCGTDTLLQDIVIVGVQPVAMFSADVTSGCAPLTVQFTDLSTGNVTGWQWTFPGGTPASATEPNPVVTYTQPGVWDVSLEVTNIAGSHLLVQTQYIVVEGVPQADFAWAADSLSVQFDNNSSGATSYWWDFGDGSTAMDVNPVHTYGEAGTYEVTLVATNDCGSDTISQTVQVTLTGVTAPPFARDLRIYPNPNDGWFTIEVGGGWRLQLALVDAWGRIVYRDEMDGGALPRLQIDGRHLPKGIYLLRLTDGQAVWYEKIAIQ